MTKKELVRKSKFLSLILRHKPETIELTLDNNGWANVKEIIDKVDRRSDKERFYFKDLKEIVETNDKQRFEFNDDETKIRARQG